MNTKTALVGLFSVCSAAAIPFGHLPCKQQGSPTPVPRVLPPPESPIGIQATIEPAEFLGDGLVGTVHVRTTDKMLLLRWSYDENGDERHFYNERIDLNYWPTAAARINDQRLTAGTNIVVAGKRPSNGNTVIERWELAFAGIPQAGNATLITKTVLYDGRQPGKQVVRILQNAHAQADAVLVQFYDSRTIFHLDTVQGAFTSLITPAQLPELSDDRYRSLVGGMDSNGCLVYIFGSGTDDGAGTVLLYDNDANGTFDAWTSLTEAEWDTVLAIDWISRG